MYKYIFHQRQKKKKHKSFLLVLKNHLNLKGRVLTTSISHVLREGVGNKGSSHWK